MHKYIKMITGEFLIFPDSLMHSNVAKSCNHEIVSAGFVFCHDGKLSCIGASESLQIASKKNDSEELKEWLNMGIGCRIAWREFD